jgi:hypothetical protein
MGPAWHGNVTTEPKGLKGIAITREDLVLDLRPLAAVEPVEVQATYHLDNSGQSRTLDLVFVFGTAGVRDFEVRLAGRLIETKPLWEGGPERRWSDFRGEGRLGRRWSDFPESWRPPREGILPETWVIYQGDPELVAPMAFTLQLPAGASTLSARYRARACGTNLNYPTTTWLVPYILAPAREWESFGRLDVTVHLPDGWQSDSKPALEREGSVLHGRFTGIPADALLVSARAPVGPELQRAEVIAVVLYVLALVGGGVVCWLVGRWQGRWLARASGRFKIVLTVLVIPVGVLLGLLWAAAIFGALWWEGTSMYAALAGQEGPYFGERFILPTLGTLLLMLLVLPAGIVINWKATWRSFERAKG